ncbi:DNA translocase FtsK [Streptomyces sp. NPDC020883]|uniref:DNA translocase FtsK n=1 Tax=Streptomyces sp. NPDC020883 TaxID=3365099 RepID=UPI00379E5ECC
MEDDDALVYAPTMEESDPPRTFGLGYVAAPGGRTGVMRIDTLEDATPHIRPENIMAPVDVPWWGDQAHMDELAQTPIPGFEEAGDEDGADEAGTSFAGVDLPKAKELTAEEKVLAALRDESDPMYVDMVDEGDEIDPDDIDYVERGPAAGRLRGVGVDLRERAEQAGEEGTDPPDQGRESLEGGPGRPAETDDEEVSATYGLTSNTDLTTPQETSEDVDLVLQAAELVVSTQFGSASMIQHKLRIGFERAQNHLNLLTTHKILGPANGSKSRDVLIAPDTYDEDILRQALRNEPE